jgi:hypothetical protein
MVEPSSFSLEVRSCSGNGKSGRVGRPIRARPVWINGERLKLFPKADCTLLNHAAKGTRNAATAITATCALSNLRLRSQSATEILSWSLGDVPNLEAAAEETETARTSPVAVKGSRMIDLGRKGREDMDPDEQSLYEAWPKRRDGGHDGERPKGRPGGRPCRSAIVCDRTFGAMTHSGLLDCRRIDFALSDRRELLVGGLLFTECLLENAGTITSAK